MEKETTYYHVTATFVDKESGETILPGALFSATEQRAQRLKSADVIGEEATKEEIAAFTGIEITDDPQTELPNKEAAQPKQSKGKKVESSDSQTDSDGGKDADNIKEG